MIGAYLRRRSKRKQVLQIIAYVGTHMGTSFPKLLLRAGYGSAWKDAIDDDDDDVSINEHAVILTTICLGRMLYSRIPEHQKKGALRAIKAGTNEDNLANNIVEMGDRIRRIVNDQYWWNFMYEAMAALEGRNAQDRQHFVFKANMDRLFGRPE